MKEVLEKSARVKLGGVSESDSAVPTDWPPRHTFQVAYSPPNLHFTYNLDALLHAWNLSFLSQFDVKEGKNVTRSPFLPVSSRCRAPMLHPTFLPGFSLTAWTS